MTPPQPHFADGSWETSSKFAWGPEDRLLIGHINIVSTARDLEAELGQPLTRELAESWMHEHESDPEWSINRPLIEAGLQRRGL